MKTLISLLIALCISLASAITLATPSVTVGYIRGHTLYLTAGLRKVKNLVGHHVMVRKGINPNLVGRLTCKDGRLFIHFRRTPATYPVPDPIYVSKIVTLHTKIKPKPVPFRHMCK